MPVKRFTRVAVDCVVFTIVAVLALQAISHYMFSQ
jgi:hypothetical protein